VLPRKKPRSIAASETSRATSELGRSMFDGSHLHARGKLLEIHAMRISPAVPINKARTYARVVDDQTRRVLPFRTTALKSPSHRDVQSSAE
jgi:hypothetical protein